MKSIALFGSSGSIGTGTLDVVRKYPELFRIEALAVNNNIDLLRKQIREFQPRYVCTGTQESARQLREELPSDINVLYGAEGLNTIASEADYDIFAGAMVGFAGLAPTTEAIKRGKRIALANKETLVVAGSYIMDLCRTYDAEMIPVDSEHSAIFQCLTGEKVSEVKKLVLTASGGPFLHKTKEEIENVTVEQALNHPTWKMGAKITIDSASMMNKGLEIIEAYWLFGFPKNKIEVVIHPQSVIHSMVEFVDGSVKAQLSVPDMRLPIQYALTHPERLPAEFVTTNLPSLKNLTFFEPDFGKFECLNLAYRVLDEGGAAPCVLNAANEIAVARFLKSDISFTRIPYIISKTLDQLSALPAPCGLEDYIEADKLAREIAISI